MSVKLGDAIVYVKGDDKGLDSTLSGSKTKTQTWASGVSAMVGGAIGAAITVVGVKAIQGLISISKDMIGGAMDLEGVAAGYKATVESMGESSDLMLKKLQEGGAGMVKDKDLMIAFNKAAQLVGKEFAGSLPEGMEYFRKVANATGQDVNYLMDSYVTGIGRLSPMILDNLGIQVDLTAANEEWAKQNGTTVAEMSKTEKQLALNAQVMQKLEENTASLPDVLGTAKQASAEFSVTWQNFKDKIGLALIPLFTDIMGNLSELADKWLPIITDWLTNKLIPKLSILFGWIQDILNSEVVGFIERLFGLKKPEDNAMQEWMDDIGISIDNADREQTEFGNNAERVAAQFKLSWEGTAAWFKENVAGPMGGDSDEIAQLLNALGTTMRIGWTWIKSVALAVWDGWGKEIIDVIILPFKIMFAIAAAELHVGWVTLKETTLALISGDWSEWGENLQIAWDESLNMILSLFGTTIDDIRIKAKSFTLGLTLIGKEWIQGLIYGISSKAQELISSITGPIKDAISQAKNLLGIQSPSKVFEGIGNNMMLGMERGVAGASSSPVNAIRSVVPQLTGAAAGGGGMGNFNVTLTAPLVITAGSQYEAERILTPIINNVVRKAMEGR